MSYIVSVLLFLLVNVVLTAAIWKAFSKYDVLSRKPLWFSTILIAPTLGLIGLMVVAYLQIEAFAAVAAILSFFPSLVLSLATVLILDRRYG